MTTLPEWFVKENTPTTIDELPDYHARHLARITDELRGYVDEALAHGCALVYDKPCCNSLGLVHACTDPDGNEVVFYQLVVDEPEMTTFLFRDRDGVPVETNRCSQCAGIPIWEVERLLKASLACGKCGKRVESFSELEYYPFAGLGCPECARKGRDEFEAKQLWR